MVYEKITQGDTTVAEMYITYGETGPLYIDYNGTIYYYILNGQGDVVGLARWDEPVDVTYSYNAWGELERITGNLASTLGLHNPLRYRGYVYDTETEQYYLNSRYYNPKWGRFINADVYISTGQGMLGYSMFAYCNNNPVNACDPSGEDAVWIQSFNKPWALGHTGLLIQGPGGIWYEFYWGQGNKKENNYTNVYLLPVAYELSHIIKKDGSYHGGMIYQKTIIIEGDFSDCYNYINDILKKEKRYNVLSFNCLQASIDVLLQGKFKRCYGDYYLFLKDLSKVRIPNKAYNMMKAFNDYVDTYWSYPWYRRANKQTPYKWIKRIFSI